MVLVRCSVFFRNNRRTNWGFYEKERFVSGYGIPKTWLIFVGVQQNLIVFQYFAELRWEDMTMYHP